MNLRKNQKGFTLLELLVVIVIVVILATMAIVTYGSVLNKNKQRAAAARAENIWVIAEAINRDITFGTIVIGQHYSNTLNAINDKTSYDTQIKSVITITQWNTLTTEGNYISVTDNKITAVYVYLEGKKVRVTSAGTSFDN